MRLSTKSRLKPETLSENPLKRPCSPTGSSLATQTYPDITAAIPLHHLLGPLTNRSWVKPTRLGRCSLRGVVHKVTLSSHLKRFLVRL